MNSETVGTVAMATVGQSLPEGKQTKYCSWKQVVQCRRSSDTLEYVCVWGGMCVMSSEWLDTCILHPYIFLPFISIPYCYYICYYISARYSVGGRGSVTAASKAIWWYVYKPTYQTFIFCIHLCFNWCTFSFPIILVINHGKKCSVTSDKCLEMALTYL